MKKTRGQKSRVRVPLKQDIKLLMIAFKNANIGSGEKYNGEFSEIFLF
jgi:hypothetical protein